MVFQLTVINCLNYKTYFFISAIKLIIFTTNSKVCNSYSKDPDLRIDAYFPNDKRKNEVVSKKAFINY